VSVRPRLGRNQDALDGSGIHRTDSAMAGGHGRRFAPTRGSAVRAGACRLRVSPDHPVVGDHAGRRTRDVIGRRSHSFHRRRTNARCHPCKCETTAQEVAVHRVHVSCRFEAPRCDPPCPANTGRALHFRPLRRLRLLTELRKRVTEWKQDDCLEASLILVIAFPLQRDGSASIEVTDTWAFVTAESRRPTSRVS
jgi:hypothetical protein